MKICRAVNESNWFGGQHHCFLVYDSKINKGPQTIEQAKNKKKRTLTKVALYYNDI